MRLILFVLVLGIAASGWAAHIFLGGLAEDEDMVIRREFTEKFQAMEPDASGGDREAQTRLGLLYLNAHDLVRDPAQAIEWFLRAAKQGEPRAQFLLGQQYEDGVGVRQDYKEAARWYDRAAKIGRYPDAEYALGNLYSRGLGVGYSNATAMEWYQKSAEGGQPVGQYLAGRIHEAGYGVRIDLIQAYVWYALASRDQDRVVSENPDYDPVKALARVKDVMNRSQIEAADKLLARWKPSH